MAKFIAPERDPKRLQGSFTTSQGTPETYRDASEGFSRFWTWMEVNNTGLGSFSTDECVDGAWHVLCKLQSSLATYQASLPPDGKAWQDAEDCRIQLANVMRRRASSRVTSANAGQAKATIEPATKDPTVQALMGLFGMG